VRVPRVRWLAALGALAIGSLALPAGADTPDPSPWPQTQGVDPGIDTTAHSIRIAGPDRTQTSLSAALLQRGDGGYPFSTSDRTSGVGVDLTGARQWWGLGSCPYAVLVTAGDTVADSLAAASLSDPTDGSSEPQLTRTATSDAVLAPIGRRSRVDTDSAPIVVTASARQGATGLSPAARQAVLDLADGGCDTVRSAIVVGGQAAIPAAVDQELLDLGLDQVFRVAGTDRFDTAADIARALGTGEAVPPSTQCVDDDVTDGDARMGFHGNAAVELRASATRCEVLGRTVVLTDGVTGADALAAGWWTSTWQVPVLLVDGDGELPAATSDALKSLVIDNVVVLGGRGRIPDQTLANVQSFTGAAVRRVAGDDRYATSAAMAQVFGGWFPTGDARDHDGSMVCLASSSGTGGGSVGWPDALGAGPWCAEAGGLAGATPAPVRGLPPVSGPNPRATRGLRPSHDAVPVLLTPAGSAELAPAVADLLAGAFDPADVWCSSIQASGACLDPGFVVAFGGSAVLADGAVRQAARAVSGETYVVFDDQAPFAEPGFFTELDLAPVYADGGAAPDQAIGRVCAPRGTLRGVRWHSAYGDLETSRFLAEHDLLLTSRYVRDRDGVARSPGTNAPTCTRVGDPTTGLVNALGTSLSGRTTTVGVFDVAADRRLRLSDPIEQEGAEVAEGTATDRDRDDGTSTRVVFTDTDLSGVVATSRGEAGGVTDATIEIVLTRGDTATEPDRFTAAFAVATARGTVTGTATGEARFTLGTWQLRGAVRLGDGTWNADAGTGGFVADLVAHDVDSTDDQLAWRIDALLASALPGTEP